MIIAKGPGSSGQSDTLKAASTTGTAVPAGDSPEYAPQSQFLVGKRTTPAPLLTPSQIQVHLGLLRAFRELKLKVQESSDVANSFPPLAGALDPEARWVWFLELALERCVKSSFAISWQRTGNNLSDFGDGPWLSVYCILRRLPWTTHH